MTDREAIEVFQALIRDNTAIEFDDSVDNKTQNDWKRTVKIAFIYAITAIETRADDKNFISQLLNHIDSFKIEINELEDEIAKLKKDRIEREAFISHQINKYDELKKERAELVKLLSQESVKNAALILSKDEVALRELVDKYLREVTHDR